MEACREQVHSSGTGHLVPTPGFPVPAICSNLFLHSGLGELIAYHGHQARNHILDFHVHFEESFPFEDGNGRIGRLILFKECLFLDIMPFIIDDKRRSR